MAYLKELPKPRCCVSGCIRPARYTLINRFNAPTGDYCGAHARAARDEMERREKAAPNVRGDA